MQDMTGCNDVLTDVGCGSRLEGSTEGACCGYEVRASEAYTGSDSDLSQ